MKLCVFSDIHGNSLYFDAVLNVWKDMKIDQYFFLGDAIGYFPDGNGVLERLKKMKVSCIKGNHEAMLIGSLPLSPEKDRVYQLMKQRNTLKHENLTYIKSWPTSWGQSLDGIQLRFVHGTLADAYSGYGYEDSDFAAFDQPGLDVLFIGQTHRPWQRQNDHTLIINVGSIGLPRDYGNRPSFAILDTLTKTAEIHRIVVDPQPILDQSDSVDPIVLDVLRRE